MFKYFLFTSTILYSSLAAASGVEDFVAPDYASDEAYTHCERTTGDPDNCVKEENTRVLKIKPIGDKYEELCQAVL